MFQAGWPWLATTYIKKIFSLIIWLGLFPACVQKNLENRNPPKKCFFQKMWLSGGFGFPSVILVNKPLKALYLCFKIVYQHLLYLLLLWTYRHFKITQGQTRFFNGILGGVKRQTSRVAFNGPRQQCLTDTMKTQLSPRETCQPTRWLCIGVGLQFYLDGLDRSLCHRLCGGSPCATPMKSNSTNASLPRSKSNFIKVNFRVSSF